MIHYEIKLKKSAQKQFENLPKEIKPRILKAINALQSNPLPANAKKLVDRDSYRLRVGEYRIIYTVENNILKILVFSVGHRKEVYRNLN